jgi:phosphinothricin acetyltransferase
MEDYAIRAATLDDLDALTDIYNHYIVNTAITFDLKTLTAAARRGWFDDHGESGPHRLLVRLTATAAAWDTRAAVAGDPSRRTTRPSKPASIATQMLLDEAAERRSIQRCSLR